MTPGIGYVSENGVYPASCVRGPRKDEWYICRRCGMTLHVKRGDWPPATRCAKSPPTRFSSAHPHGWIPRSFVYDAWVIRAHDTD